MIDVMLVDDHSVVREGLELLLAAFPDVRVVATAKTGEQAVDLAVELSPDVVLMDLSMPGMGGVAATGRICDEQANCAVVILTTFADSDRVMAALDSGAVGYLMKDCEPEELHAGIVAAAGGGSPLDPRVARTLLEARRGGRHSGGEVNLTAKQTEVLRLVAEGLPNRLIARRMGISEKTVKAHLTQVYTVLGVSDRVQAALWAQRHLPDE